MKVLFLVTYPTEGPSNRFRVEQYLSFLKEHGITYSLRPFWESKIYKVLYEEGHYWEKTLYFLKGCCKRLNDLIHLSGYDLVFVHREAFPVGGAFFEKIISLTKPIVYDFDDSIFLPNSSGANRIVDFFKYPCKVPKIIKLSTAVIAGNNYLKEFALKYNNNVVVIPTCIDTQKFTPRDSKHDDKIVIGWIGTYTTSKYLKTLKEVFTKLLDRYKNSVEIRIVGSQGKLFDNEKIIYKHWILENEIKDLQAFDIGLMPICDDEWTRGKCSFKLIQYLAVGAASVVSPVGMNKEIIVDGKNGFFADTQEEWFQRISQLVENKNLRHAFSQEGRKTIEKYFSLRENLPKFIDIVKNSDGKHKLGLREKSAKQEHCFYCDSTNLSLFASGVHDRFGVSKKELTILKCSNCGSFLQSPLPKEEDLAGLYPEKYSFKKEGAGLFKKIWDSFEWAIFYYPVLKGSVNLIVKTTGLSSGKAFELGCGSGLRLKELSKLGFVVEGADFSQADVKFARESLGLNVWKSDIENAGLALNKYDLIIGFAFFEHLLDPGKMLEKIGRSLTKNGWVVLSVPIADSWLAKLFKERWSCVTEAPRHISIPSHSGMMILLEKSGFKDVQCRAASLIESACDVALTIWPKGNFYMTAKQSSIEKIINRLLVGLLTALAVLPILILKIVGVRQGFEIFLAHKEG